eukprot:g6269.t1
MEMMEENHNVEVRVYIQKVKHLEFEHKNNRDQVKTDGGVKRSVETDLSTMRKHGLLTTKAELKDKIKERKELNAAEVNSIKEKQKMNLEKLREGFEENLQKTSQRYEQKLNQLRDDMELRRKVEIHEIEERKNLHVNDLMRNHEKAFSQIKNYYNDITKDNLKLIKALKTEVKSMKNKATTNVKEVELISQENKRLMEPLGVAVQEVQALKEKLRDREKDNLALTNSEARSKSVLKEIKRAQEKLKGMEKKFASVLKERDELRATFEETVRTVQRKSEIKNLMLRKQTASADEELAKRQNQLDKVLEAARLDPMVVSNLESKLDEILNTRNATIKDLRYEIIRVSKAHDDAMRTLETKLAEFGIPHDQSYLDRSAFIGSTTHGPAGLVTVPDQ